MDVFALRQRLVDDYAAYIRSFILIRDRRINAKVDQDIKDGLLWPDPLIQLNPAFEPGATVSQLVDAGVLHPRCKQIFAIKEPGKVDRPLRLHRHQAEAVSPRPRGDNYVLTTGTGSGKSLAYIVPDRGLRPGRHGSGHGIKAIVVYPMNALANSQVRRAGEVPRARLSGGQGPGHLRAVHGPGEMRRERQAIMANPPDILLTNYVMLELLLTRPGRGADRQGRRRVCASWCSTSCTPIAAGRGPTWRCWCAGCATAFNSPHMQCVGTSATLAGEGGSTRSSRREVAQRGEPAVWRTGGARTRDRGDAAPGHRRNAVPTTRPSSKRCARAWPTPPGGPPTTTKLRGRPAVQLDRERRSAWRAPGPPERAAGAPSPPNADAAANGAALQSEPALTGADAIDRGAWPRHAGAPAGRLSCAPNAGNGFPGLRFQAASVHRRGDTVYASLEPPDERYITVYGQQFEPGERRLGAAARWLFCRECGQEYFMCVAPCPTAAMPTGHAASAELDRTMKHGEAGLPVLQRHGRALARR